MSLFASWSWDAVQHALPHTTPTAMLIAIGISSIYIFYKMLRIAFGYQTTKKSSQPHYVGARDSNGLYTGKGELYNRNGDVYIGEFLNGLQHGHGKYVFNIPSTTSNSPTQSNTQSNKKVKQRKQKKSVTNQPLSNSSPSYEGDFIEGMFHGRGREMYADGSVYVGDFVAGHREGRGQMRYANGSVFDGTWKQGTKHGKGRIKEAGSNTWRSGYWNMGRQAINAPSSLNPSTESSDGREEEKAQ